MDHSFDINAAGVADILTYPAPKVTTGKPHYGFDTTADEGFQFIVGKLPALAGSMTITIDVFATLTTGTVAMAVQALAYTVGTDATSFPAAAFAAPVVGTATNVSGTTLVPVQHTITLTTGAQQDNAATGDYFILKIFRDVSADTLAGDAEVSAVHLSYAAS